MKLICTPTRTSLPEVSEMTLPVFLYGRGDATEMVSVGAAVAEEIAGQGLTLSTRGWDLLSLALSVIAADTAVLKPHTPDGWTREIELSVAVSDADFWITQSQLIERILQFLTTDIWSISFVPTAFEPPSPKERIVPNEEAVALLSGGVDSLVGVIDLITRGVRTFAVSQIVLGDADKQTKFATELGGGLRHLQLNHNVNWAETNDLNQRARSFIFLVYGALAATTVRNYLDGASVSLYVSENGLISINPPLTDGRLGSLSTRTTHPVFLSLFQQLLWNAGIRVDLINPYQFKTKGEMLAECGNQDYLIANAHLATSCGRYRRNGFRHCGRCVPCMIRRAAFHRWPQQDQTIYVYGDLGRNDSDHAGFDDVRSAFMAVEIVEESGIDSLLGSSLASDMITDTSPYQKVAERGIAEVGAFLKNAGVK